MDKQASHKVSFNVNIKRGQGDKFLNTYSVFTRDVFECNTNVQLGSIHHIFYTTCYVANNTKDEDTKTFQNTGNTLVRRTHRSIMTRRA